jgi:exodeoxyribonuclease-5
MDHIDDLPVPSDRLVCLRNSHEKGLLNGAIWYATDIGEYGGDLLTMTVQSEDTDQLLEVEAHTHYFLGNEDKLGWWERKEAEEFDYGYALTVHKAQGSQWDDVMLFDESWCFRQDRWRWLYTGITRAAKRVTVVRM